MNKIYYKYIIMDLSIYCNIAANSLETYVALLAIPDFARYVRARDYKFLECFKQVITNEESITYLFNGAKYMVKYLKYKLIVWYKNDVIHRDIYPAIVGAHGTMIWLQNGLIHRDNNAPAFINMWEDQIINSPLENNIKSLARKYNGSNFIALYQNGILHSNGDVATITGLRMFFDGGFYYYKWGKLHRDNDLPAIVRHNGTKLWYQNDQLHRDNDQPALIWWNDYKEYYRHGTQYTPPTN